MPSSKREVTGESSPDVVREERDKLSTELLTPTVFIKLVKWLREPVPRPAVHAFTAGIERQIAYALEMDVLPEIKRLRIESFSKGARAMFDSLLCRAANHYHGDPEVQKQCDYDNALIEEWVVDALEEISPDDYTNWRSINDAYRNGFEAGKKSAAKEL